MPVAAFQHGLLAELVDRRQARHEHGLRPPDLAVLARVARIDGAAAHVEVSRRQLRNRGAGVRRLGEVRDGQRRVRVEVHDQLAVVLRDAVLPLDPQTHVDRQVAEAPRVLAVGGEEVVAEIAGRLDGRLGVRRNAEHEGGQAQSEVARRELRRVAGLPRELVGERQLARRVAAEAALALREAGVHSATQGVRAAHLRQVDRALQVRRPVAGDRALRDALIAADVDRRQHAVVLGGAERVEIPGHAHVARLVLVQPPQQVVLEEPIARHLAVDDRLAADVRPVADHRPVVARPIDRVEAFELRHLIGPVADRLEERVAGHTEEEAIVRRQVVVDPAGVERAHGLVGLAAPVVIAGRRGAVLEQVLVRRRHHLPVQVVERVHDAVRRDDVVRERIADEAVRVRGVAPDRERVVDLVLRRVRQPEQIGEIPAQLRLTGRHRARRLVLSGDEVVDVRVVGEEEELVAAIDDLGDHDRAAGGEREVVRAPGLVERLSSRRERQALTRIELVDLVRPGT